MSAAIVGYFGGPITLLAIIFARSASEQKDVYLPSPAVLLRTAEVCGACGAVIGGGASYRTRHWGTMSEALQAAKNFARLLLKAILEMIRES